MGAYGMIGIGSLIGMGAGGMKTAQAGQTPAGIGNTAPVPAAPVAPATTEAENGRTANPQMEAERERERQAALARMQRAPEIFTSGLGASGLAETSKKTLLGG